MGLIGILYKLFSSIFFGASIALLYPLALRFMSDAESHVSGAAEMGLEALKANWSVAVIVALVSFLLIRRAIKKVFFISLALFAVVALLYLFLPEGTVDKFVLLAAI